MDIVETYPIPLLGGLVKPLRIPGRTNKRSPCDAALSFPQCHVKSIAYNAAHCKKIGEMTANVPSSAPEHANGSGSVPLAENNHVSADGETTTAAPGLSADEIALYDRQIRLWGAQAQERIRSANILLVSLRALGTEIAKNLTLAGISSLTIVDDDVVTEEDLGAQYFLREEDIGKPELNPRVVVKTDCTVPELISKDPSYFESYDCVVACDHDFLTLSAVNTAVRFANRPFYAAGIHGFYGFIFADLVTHEFVVEREKSNVPTVIGAESPTRSVLSVTNKKDNEGKNIEIVKKLETYCPLILANTSPLPAEILSRRRQMKGVPALLPCLRAVFDFQRVHARLPGHTSQDLVAFTTLATERSRELQLPPETLRAGFLRSFIQNIGAELVPTAAFVGGRLSEDVINVLGKRQQPIQNFALFDGDSLDGRIYSLYSPPPEVAMMTNGMMPMDLTNVVQPGLPLSQMGNGAQVMQEGAALLPATDMPASVIQHASGPREREKHIRYVLIVSSARRHSACGNASSILFPFHSSTPAIDRALPKDLLLRPGYVVGQLIRSERSAKDTDICFYPGARLYDWQSSSDGLCCILQHATECLVT
nr:dna damage tolerance protein rhc31 [Quercus suber]